MLAAWPWILPLTSERRRVRPNQRIEPTSMRFLDLENIILTGEIIERQRDRQTREVKCVIRGFTLDDLEAETIVKIGPTGRLVVITVYLA